MKSGFKRDVASLRVISELLVEDHTQSLPPSSISEVKSEEVKNLCQEKIRVK